uniref:FLYWCH-type domain-containing protein n=1 Tax=Panagrolaimus davidi TaxID=227884 RepID=A0A914PKG8_9BILA
MTLKNGNRIIVKEENDKTKVREYSKSNNSWICSNRHCKYATLKIKYGIVFAAITHNCEPREYSMALKIQELLKQGKTTEALGLTMKRRSLRNTSNQSLSASTDQSLSDSTLDELILANIIKTRNNSCNATNDYALNNDTPSSSSQTSTKTLVGQISDLITIYPNDMLGFDLYADQYSTANTVSSLLSETSALTENFEEPSQSSVKREFDDEFDDCIFINETAAKKRKIDFDNNEIFSFERPSTLTLKEMCKKLKIEYKNDVYKFWGDIVFEKITPFSKNVKTHSFKSKNIFACLSQFFTGTNESCFDIQYIISKAFRDDLIETGEMSRAKIDELSFFTTVTDEHIEFISKFLFCKIGIYENGILKKYGNWENQNQNNSDVLNLILSFENGFFSVVLDL